jgi:hypothetical protein
MADIEKKINRKEKMSKFNGNGNIIYPLIVKELFYVIFLNSQYLARA